MQLDLELDGQIVQRFLAKQHFGGQRDLSARAENLLVGPVDPELIDAQYLVAKRHLAQNIDIAVLLPAELVQAQAKLGARLREGPGGAQIQGHRAGGVRLGEGLDRHVAQLKPGDFQRDLQGHVIEQTSKIKRLGILVEGLAHPARNGHRRGEVRPDDLLAAPVEIIVHQDTPRADRRRLIATLKAGRNLVDLHELIADLAGENRVFHVHNHVDLRVLDRPFQADIRHDRALDIILLKKGQRLIETLDLKRRDFQLQVHHSIERNFNLPAQIQVQRHLARGAQDRRGIRAHLQGFDAQPARLILRFEVEVERAIYFIIEVAKRQVDGQNGLARRADQVDRAVDLAAHRRKHRLQLEFLAKLTDLDIGEFEVEVLGAAGIKLPFGADGGVAAAQTHAAEANASAAQINARPGRGGETHVRGAQLQLVEFELLEVMAGFAARLDPKLLGAPLGELPAGVEVGAAERIRPGDHARCAGLDVESPPRLKRDARVKRVDFFAACAHLARVQVHVPA